MAGTKIGRLAQEVADLNPWWRSADWARNDLDLRRVRDSGLCYASACLDDLRVGGMYVLRGPRRVGKTVASKQAIDRLTAAGVPLRAIVRVAVDGWDAGDLRSVVQNITLPPLEDGERRWWFIDEITGVTGDWAQSIKWLRDNIDLFREATVIITGSSASDLTQAIGLWAGRRGDAADADRTILPIGFRSFVHLLSSAPPERIAQLALGDLRTRSAREAYQALVPWLADLVRLWDRYLLCGGFPESVAACRRADPIPPSLVDAIRDVIFKDAFRNSKASLTTNTSLFVRLADGMANPVNRSSIAQDVDVDQTTVARHIDYLCNGYLAWTLPQKDPDGWFPWRKAQPKVYMVDPLVARLPHLQRQERHDVDPTILPEMMVGAALRRAADREGYGWSEDESFFFAQTPSRKEIDFVSALLGDVAVEGKAVEDGKWRGEAATLDASIWKGIVATRNVLDLDSEDASWAVPAGLLAYLIDS